MSAATLFLISVLVCLVQSNGQGISIEETLKRAAIAEQTVRETLAAKLPPSEAASQAGQFVLATFQQGLKTCEDNLRRNQNVAEYSICVGNLQGLAMASIGELAGEHWAKSGASRPTLFW